VSRAYQPTSHAQNLYFKGNNIPTIHVRYKLIHERPSLKKEMFLLFLAQIHES
jgi:hypothetical protein